MGGEPGLVNRPWLGRDRTESFAGHAFFFSHLTLIYFFLALSQHSLSQTFYLSSLFLDDLWSILLKANVNSYPLPLNSGL